MNDSTATPGMPGQKSSQPYEAFLQQLSVKGRATIEKHDKRCGEDGLQGYCDLWKRLAGVLAGLAGHATEVLGQQTVKFYIADGKYKLQVFALQGTPQGTLAIYIPDVAKLAIKRHIVSGGSEPDSYKVRGCDEPLRLEPINAQTQDLTACKAMVGWGRQALRADLNENTDEKQVRAVETMAQLAAEKWLLPPG